MGGGDHQPHGEFLLLHRVHEHGSGHHRFNEPDGDAVVHQDLRDGPGKTAREKAQVMADHHRFVVLFVFLEIERRGLGHPAHVAEGKPIANDGPPAAGPELDHLLHDLSPKLL